MKRGTSTGQFILAGLWFLLALLWYFFNHNLFIALVWLAAAVIVLIVGLRMRKTEKSDREKDS